MQNVFSFGTTRVVELGAGDIDTLQRFFDANPGYFLAVTGEPARTDEAAQEYADMPPAGMSYERKWLLGFVDEAGELVAMAHLWSDFLAPRVWLVGLFIVATRLHGTGASAEMYRQLEAWMRSRGAAWIRLGAVVGNVPAERFWLRMGYTEIRQRAGLVMGQRTNTIRVLWKPLAGGSLDEYLALVPYDRQESAVAKATSPPRPAS